MKKKEKYSKEIVEIICNGKNIAVDKKTERPVVCSDFDCDKCMFRAENNCRRRYLLKEWAESEYIEKPVISKKDKAFLEYLKEEYKYIARDKNDVLYAYNAEPCKARESWNSGRSDYWFRLNHRFDVNFPMVKWSDEEPWLIEDLKNLEVVEEYE
jgi:hypothetical protein